MTLVASTHSRTVAAAENYTIGDIVSNSASNGAGTPWQFSNVGSFGYIRGGVITCTEDSITTLFRLHLFTASPTASELDDNVALAIAEADRGAYIGFVDFPAMVDVGVPSVSQTEVLKPFTGLGTLYGILEDRSGETAETAAQTISITLYVEKV